MGWNNNMYGVLLMKRFDLLGAGILCRFIFQITAFASSVPISGQEITPKTVCTID